MIYNIIPLNSSIDKKEFCCGKELLDKYLQFQASQDVKRKLCVVFVMLNDNSILIGYYTLSNASVESVLMPENIQKKMPQSYHSLPVTLLGRLAVDKSQAGKGMGAILLIDALKRCYDVANKSLGSIGVVVDPLDDSAVKFYEKYGFIMLPDSGKMFLPMATIAQLKL